MQQVNHILCYHDDGMHINNLWSSRSVVAVLGLAVPPLLQPRPSSAFPSVYHALWSAETLLLLTDTALGSEKLPTINTTNPVTWRPLLLETHSKQFKVSGLVISAFLCMLGLNTR